MNLIAQYVLCAFASVQGCRLIVCCKFGWYSYALSANGSYSVVRWHKRPNFTTGGV